MNEADLSERGAYGGPGRLRRSTGKGGDKTPDISNQLRPHKFGSRLLLRYVFPLLIYYISEIGNDETVVYTVHAYS